MPTPLKDLVVFHVTYFDKGKIMYSDYHIGSQECLSQEIQSFPFSF